MLASIASARKLRNPFYVLNQVGQKILFIQSTICDEQPVMISTKLLLNERWQIQIMFLPQNEIKLKKKIRINY